MEPPPLAYGTNIYGFRSNNKQIWQDVRPKFTVHTFQTLITSLRLCHMTNSDGSISLPMRLIDILPILHIPIPILA